MQNASRAKQFPESKSHQHKHQHIILVGGGGHCSACIDVIEKEGRIQSSVLGGEAYV